MSASTINGRITNLLGRLDTMSQRLKVLHREQQMEVRDARGKKDTLRAYRSCHYCASASLALDTLRGMLFNEGIAYDGPDGSANTEQNEELLCLRFHDNAGNLGLPFEEVADAVLETAEMQCQQAQDLLNEALIWASN